MQFTIYSSEKIVKIQIQQVPVRDFSEVSAPRSGINFHDFRPTNNLALNVTTHFY